MGKDVDERSPPSPIIQPPSVALVVWDQPAGRSDVALVGRVGHIQYLDVRTLLGQLAHGTPAADDRVIVMRCEHEDARVGVDLRVLYQRLPRPVV